MLIYSIFISAGHYQMNGVDLLFYNNGSIWFVCEDVIVLANLSTPEGHPCFNACELEWMALHFFREILTQQHSSVPDNNCVCWASVKQSYNTSVCLLFAKARPVRPCTKHRCLILGGEQYRSLWFSLNKTISGLGDQKNIFFLQPAETNKKIKMSFELLVNLWKHWKKFLWWVEVSSVDNVSFGIFSNIF